MHVRTSNSSNTPTPWAGLAVQMWLESPIDAPRCPGRGEVGHHIDRCISPKDGRSVLLAVGRWPESTVDLSA